MPFALLLQESPAPQGGGLPQLLIMVGFMFAIFYFIVIRPQRARERQRLEMLSKIKKNDHVLTSGGIYGTVMNVKDDEVSLRIDDGNNVRVRVTRSSIVGVVGPKDEKENKE
jgi:preprotein translocase subunit YajC